MLIIQIENKNSRSYGEYESYILKKARELLITNELDLAAEISLSVIDHNLDNFDAVALYTSIDTAIKARDAKVNLNRGFAATAFFDVLTYLDFTLLGAISAKLGKNFPPNSVKVSPNSIVFFRQTSYKYL